MVQTLQKIGALSSIGLVVGSIVGTGIFVTPIMVAQFSNHLGLIFLLWALGGLMCALGGEIYGRMGQRFPLGGGQYIYLEKSLGKNIALVYGWMSLLIISPSMIAGYSMFFGEQAKNLVPSISDNQIQLIAILFMSLITTINYFGIRLAGNFEKIVVSLQILLILALLFFLTTYVSPATDSFDTEKPEFSLATGAAAIVGILWSYEGFNCLSFVAHEIKDSAKRLTFYIMTGCVVVLILYLIINFLALTYIPFDELIHAPNIAVPLASRAFGESGASLTFIMMIIAVFMTSVPAVMIGPRVTQQMAIEGQLPKKLAELHSKYTSPHIAILVQFLISAVFIFLGTFEWLITCFITISWCFYILIGIGFLKLERNESQNRSSASFLKTSIFISLALLVIAIQTLQNPVLSITGASILVLSYIFVRLKLERKRLKSNPLISASDLKNYLNNKNLVLLDCSFDLKDPTLGEKKYQIEHIPSAIYVHLEKDLSGPKTSKSGRHPLPSVAEMEELFSRLGIDSSKTVIAYDSQDMMYAARCWWMLKYCGHSNVYVLNGGFQKWKASGFETESDIARPIPSVFKANIQTTLLIEIDHIASVKTLVDSRDPARFRGEIEPIDKRAGHIPGAQNYFYKLNLNEDGTLKDSDIIKNSMNFLEKDSRTGFYCGSGVSACVNVLAAHSAGYSEVGLYAGSWSEWIEQKN